MTFAMGFLFHYCSVSVADWPKKPIVTIVKLALKKVVVFNPILKHSGSFSTLLEDRVAN